MFKSFLKKTNHKVNKRRLLLLSIALWPSISAGTVPGTSITSDQLEVAFKGDQTEFFFKGNVKLMSPEFSAECTAAKITTFGTSVDLASGLDSIKEISATGPLNLTYGERFCSADRAEITPADATIILAGKATVKDTMGSVSGSEIRINYETKSVIISSGEAQNSVNVNLSPPTENKGVLQNTQPQTSMEITPKNTNIFTENEDALPVQ
ncbi:MAG: LptA/OstA family protein [Puniceicoccales bacterium]|jgi:lipopolysaccharide export system protein LptA|nr:LptA/OstA family protein [Puniceicoccales bacterium]